MANHMHIDNLVQRVVRVADAAGGQQRAEPRGGAAAPPVIAFAGVGGAGARAGAGAGAMDAGDERQRAEPLDGAAASGGAGAVAGSGPEPGEGEAGGDDSAGSGSPLPWQAYRPRPHGWAWDTPGSSHSSGSSEHGSDAEHKDAGEEEGVHPGAAVLAAGTDAPSTGHVQGDEEGKEDVEPGNAPGEPMVARWRPPVVAPGAPEPPGAAAPMVARWRPWEQEQGAPEQPGAPAPFRRPPPPELMLPANILEDDARVAAELAEEWAGGGLLHAVCVCLTSTTPHAGRRGWRRMQRSGDDCMCTVQP
jgi:hypothetical protein